MNRLEQMGFEALASMRFGVGRQEAEALRRVVMASPEPVSNEALRYSVYSRQHGGPMPPDQVKVVMCRLRSALTDSWTEQPIMTVRTKGYAILDRTKAEALIAEVAGA